ncbi:Uncharacterised protein [Candidatus Anstonella stagnisolia]|nr:Uncharacterised protein [Candidatus Anstonella stagnisolia]
MAQTQTPYAILDARWRKLCSLLLGGEVGQLSEYSHWLYEGNGPRFVASSSSSGKKVVFPSNRYPKGAKYASFDEMQTATQEKTDFSGMEIPQLVASLQNILCYSGNIVLGNCTLVEDSTAIPESHFVLHSERVAYSKYVAYSTRGGYSDTVFGCYGFGPAQFSMKCKGITSCTRCFEVSRCDNSSDCYYSHGLSGCTDCIFCFNLRNKRFCIGNVQLSPEKYRIIKTRLLAEIREKLAKEKRLPALHELFTSIPADYAPLKNALASFTPPPAEKADKHRIEAAFSSTTSILFGKPLANIDEYSNWLSHNSAVEFFSAFSCHSKSPTPLPKFASFEHFPKEKLLTLEEAELAGEKLHTSAQEAEALTFQTAPSLLSKIAYFSPFWQVGMQKNNIGCTSGIDATDCYKGVLNILSKLCAFSFCPRSCEYSFGCNEGRHLSFCINCHFSAKLTRCFELDSCTNCSDSYFCHNCDNVKDSMFCFNAKNLQYAIGNVQVGREKYLEEKKKLLAYINSELEKKKGISLSIYNLKN